MSLSAGEVARDLGISTATLHLWEKRGIIKPQRTPGGWRIFSEEEVSKLKKMLKRRMQKISRKTETN